METNNYRTGCQGCEGGGTPGGQRPALLTFGPMGKGGDMFRESQCSHSCRVRGLPRKGASCLSLRCVEMLLECSRLVWKDWTDCRGPLRVFPGPPGGR